MDIKLQLREIIESHIADKKYLCQLSDDDLITKLQINSIIFMKIIIDLEDKYEIEFEFDKLNISNFRTINNLYEYIKQKIEKKSSKLLNKHLQNLDKE